MNGDRRTPIEFLGTLLRILFPLMLAGVVHGGELVSTMSVEASLLDVRTVERNPKGISGIADCRTDAECVDDNPCTEDVCVSSSCVNRPISGCVRCEPSYVCPPLDVVFIMDTSGSMKDEESALCASIDQIVTDLADIGVTVNATVLGITETSDLFSCLTDNVVSLLGDTVPGDPSACSFPDVVSGFESWGPATAIVAERFTWTDGASRIIVPVADEGPCNGNRPDGCNDPGDDRDSIENAIAVAQTREVVVSPITGTGADDCAKTLAADLASGTGGIAFATEDAGAELPGAVVDLLLALCELDFSCDNGDFCTRDDVCIDGVCVGTPIPGCYPCTAVDETCSDGNPCTEDICNEVLECITTPNYDTESYCCDPEDGVLTLIDDVDACTVDACDPETGDVEHTPMPDDTPCDDGLYCTVGDVCTGGACDGSPRDCSSLDDECNVGVCNEDTDACEPEATNENGPCDDGDVCTTADTCIDGVCVGGPPLDCSDHNVCTDDSCDASSGCVHVNNTEPCDDGNACTDNDTCVEGACEGGPPLDCNDDNICTDDICSPAQGCIYVPNYNMCDDGDICTDGDTCFGGVCVAGPPLHCDDDNVCTDDMCSPAEGCIHVPNYNLCDDGDLCTDGDTCFGGVCVAGPPLECNDDNVCTYDTCDSAVGCVFTDNTAPCDDDDACTTNDMCADGSCVGGPPPECEDYNICTDDTCHSDSGCVFTDNADPCDDGLFCTVDDVCLGGVCGGSPRDCSELDDDCKVGVCNEDSAACESEPTGENGPCDDGDECTIEDVCDDEGVCSGSSICPQLILEPVPREFSEPGSYCANEDVRVNIMLYPSTSSSGVINGGQFYIAYDSGALEVIDVEPGSSVDSESPFSYEIVQALDDPPGTIFYSVGVEPFGGQGTSGPAVMASIVLRPTVECANIGPFCFISENPRNTLLVDTSGHLIENFDACCLDDVLERCLDGLSLYTDNVSISACPQDVSVNADAGGVTALVTWDTPVLDQECTEGIELVCTGSNSLGANVDGLVMGGGRMPSGLTEFTCTATNECGEATCEWDVHVSPANLVEVSLQLSPIMAEGPLTRCIEFEFYANCVELPMVFAEMIPFGLPYDLPGHADGILFKIPAGRYVCTTARDPLHTLRSAAFLEIVDRKFVATFKGDPFFGGNWLVGGNLNGDHVIDILDFGVFAANSNQTVVDPDTPCGTASPHIDINGDGKVDSADFDFIDRNFGLGDKGSCCPGGRTATSAAVTEISVNELEAMGLGELGRADINGDGVLNEADITAYMEGRRPTESSRDRSK